MKHSFDVSVARQYDIPQAIVLEHIAYWIAKNTAEDRHFYEGRYWTYNSTKAFSVLFEYFSERQIKHIIKKLKDNELIMTGNFNKTPWDKTSWYALTDKGARLMFRGDTEIDKLVLTADQDCPLDSTDLSYPQYESVQSKTDINTFINLTGGKTDIYTDKQDLSPLAPKTTKKSSVPKETYGEYENVKLTQAEFDRLVDEYGMNDTLDAIKFLDEYIEEKPKYKSNSHNLALRRWVFNAVKEQRSKNKQNTGLPFDNIFI